MPPPVPPSVKLGRSTHGKPIWSRMAWASARERATPLLGTARPMLMHGLLELLAVLGLVDDFRPGADHLDAVLGEDAVLVQVHGGVQAGLAAEGRQQGVGPFLLDDLGDDLPGDRLDVGAVGRLRVGHDGGRVGVDQDDR